jgi:uncharacterized protein YprB with RNaseH-like and TPR domain
MAKSSSKVLVFDIESAGVQGLKADRAIITCFGYKWLGDKTRTVLKISDSPRYSWKTCHDDSWIVREASKVMGDAEAYIAHFGEGFDRPYMQAKFLQHGCSTVPEARLTDTCLITRKHLCLSSYSLANLAEFLEVDTQKMKKGRGWPDWWMGALRADRPSIDKMAAYCSLDVQCLEECFYKLRHIIPTRYLPINAAIGQALWTCAACGGHRYQSRGSHWSEKARWQRFQCQECGRWSHSAIKADKVAKV